MRPVNLPWIGAMEQYVQICVWTSDARMFDRLQHPQRFIPRLYEEGIPLNFSRRSATVQRDCELLDAKSRRLQGGLTNPVS